MYDDDVVIHAGRPESTWQLSFLFFFLDGSARTAALDDDERHTMCKWQAVVGIYCWQARKAPAIDCDRRRARICGGGNGLNLLGWLAGWLARVCDSVTHDEHLPNRRSIQSRHVTQTIVAVKNGSNR